MAEEIKKLNKEQLEAVRHGSGPLLIIAGAGTGKTTVITERIKWLISQNLAKPSEILALTFTDKAAREMEERVDIAMPYGYTQMWISTFHSFCDRILKAEAVHIGLNPGYKLMTEAETILFLRQNLFKFDLNYFRPLGNPNKFIAGILQHFSRLKDEDVSPSEYLRWAQMQNAKCKMQNDKSKLKIDREETEKYLELAGAYKTYEELKVKEGMADFADLIANALRLFRTRPNILREYLNQFKYILVDEFQDTNFAQNALAILLAGEKQNITVCADDDQSIYRWRGAAISNVIQFRERFPKAKIVVLVKNYRSTQLILDHAYQLIQNNNPDRLEFKEKIDKHLIAVRQTKPIPIEFLHADRVENEAELVARKILELTRGVAHFNARQNERRINSATPYNFKDFAILLRANNHADSFVRALARAGIPYQFLGPGMLFRQPEVKDLIAYLKVLYNFEDSVAMYRVLVMDFFEIPARDLAALTSFAKKTNLSLFESCELLVEGLVVPPKTLNIRPVVSEKGKEKIATLVKMIHRHLKLLPKETAGQILYYFLEDTGLLRQFTDYKTAVEERRAQNIAKFFDKLKTYEVEHEEASVSAVVDWIEMSLELGESPLASDMDWTENNAVNLLTVHSAKGLEFPVVFLVNLVSQRFPTIERREQIPIPQELIKEILPEGDYHLEEERRLFYVGMTRARDRLFFTTADYYGEGKREKKISLFVFEALGEKTIKQFSNLATEEKQLSLLEWEKAPEIQISPPLVKIDYLSYSQIETFRGCPLHYKLKFILKIPTPPSAAQSFGTSLHAALRDFYQAKIAGEKPQEKELLEMLEKNWTPQGFASKHHEKLSFQKAQKFLRSFWRQVKNSPVLPLALERPFTLPLKNLRLVGRIDRVDPQRAGKIEIIDYKTGANVPSQEAVDKDLQMSFYALAATQVPESPFGKKPEEVLLSLYFFETGEKVTTQRTAKHLEAAKEEILGWAEKIAKSDFRCSASEACRRCEYRLLCDVG